MKCEELLKALNDYVDGDLDPGICEEFEHHLAGCNPCQVVVDNIRKTIKLYRQSGEQVQIPPELCQKLRQCLREKWKEKFSER
jgi:anti-sigma factor RsiW